MNTKQVEVEWNDDELSRQQLGPVRGKDAAGNTYCMYHVNVVTVMTADGRLGAGFTAEDALADAARAHAIDTRSKQ